MITFYSYINFSLFFLLDMGIAAKQIQLSTFWIEAMPMVLKVSGQSGHDFVDLISWHKSENMHLIN